MNDQEKLALFGLINRLDELGYEAFDESRSKAPIFSTYKRLIARKEAFHQAADLAREAFSAALREKP